MPDDFLHSATLAGRARDCRVPSYTEVTCRGGGCGGRGRDGRDGRGSQDKVILWSGFAIGWPRLCLRVMVHI